MRPFASTISLAEALARLGGAAVPITRRERVALEAAAGRVLADSVVADRDVPPFDRSAMDGYAVKAVDTRGASERASVALRSLGTVFTGEVGRMEVGSGECVTIATGAPMPHGTDAVVMVEHTTRLEDGRVAVRVPVVAGQNIGRRGADLALGTPVIERGSVLTAARLGALAALGFEGVDVYARPRVVIASTGNEIVSPGSPLGPGQIYDINRFTLPPVVTAHGGEVIVGPTAADTVSAVDDSLETALGHHPDIIVISGGSSVGDRDLLVDAVATRGDVLFHGIAVKPGKPTLFARLGSVLLLGMPGNPSSCLSNAFLLLVPLLRRVARLPPWRPERREARLSQAVANTSGRHTFFTVRLDDGRAVPAFKGSGDITSLADADGYIEIPPDVTQVDEGTVVSVTLF